MGDKSLRPLEFQSLAQARDELKVKLSLAKSEAKSEWAELEKKWHGLEEELGRVREHTKGPISELNASVRSVAGELRQSYARIRSQLKN